MRGSVPELAVAVGDNAAIYISTNGGLVPADGRLHPTGFAAFGAATSSPPWEKAV